MYSLIALFFSIPLYFSHLFSPFGVIIGDSSSFERQKVYLFAILLLIALFEISFTKGKELLLFLRRYGLLLVALLLLPFLSAYFWGSDRGEHFFLGSFEKHHGYIWYMLIILLGTLLAVTSIREKRYFISATMISASVVATFAILEYILGASVFYSYLGTASWGERRSVSTLGNPNYVAGYLLMCLPLLLFIRSPKRWIYAILISLGLYTTGSYIGIGLLGLYVFYSLVRHLFRAPRAKIITGGLAIGCVYMVLYSLSPDKILSLESRFVLMQELWTVMVGYPFSFVFGFGPESIITYFDSTRSAVIDGYFPRSSAIDSSHNIFLDVAFQYGILSVALGSYILYKNWKKYSLPVGGALVLGLFFLSLNVTITAHMILLLLLGSFQNESKEH